MSPDFPSDLPAGGLVTVGWLLDHLAEPGLKLLDASVHMPGSGRDGRAEYLAGHLPGARFFDVETVVDRQSPYPHMLPLPGEFAAEVGTLGVASGDPVVVYDSRGIFGSARLWWMFRVFGHDRVAVLDGGLPAWLAAGGPLESGPVAVTPCSFEARFRPGLVVDRRQVLDNLTGRHWPLLDARSPGRFAGEEPEPRPGLRGGHIPGSLNLPWDRLVHGDGTLRDSAELDGLFRAAGVNPEQPLVASCGSGVTAAILALGLFRLGNPGVAVYDGSWSEWGLHTELTVITGH